MTWTAWIYFFALMPVVLFVGMIIHFAKTAQVPWLLFGLLLLLVVGRVAFFPEVIGS